MPLNGKNISKGSYDFQQDSQGLYNFRMDSRGPNLPDLGGQIALATLYASFFSSQNNHGNDRRKYRTKVGKYNKLKRAREGKLLNKKEVAETSRISQLKSKTTDSSKNTTTDTDVLSSHKIKYPSGYEEPKLQRKDIPLDLRNSNPISTGSDVIRSEVSSPSMGSKDKVFKASRQILSQDDLSQNLDKDLSIVSSKTIWSEGQSKPVVFKESFKTRQSGAVSCQNGETASSVLQSFIISQGVTQLAKIFYLSYNSQKIEFFEGRGETTSYNLDFSDPRPVILNTLRSLNPSYDAITNSYNFTKSNLKYQFRLINKSLNGIEQEYVYNTVYDTSDNFLCSNLISAPNFPPNATSYNSTTPITFTPLPVTNFSNSSLILYDNYSCTVSNNLLTLKNNGNLSYSFERVLDSGGEIAGLNLTNHKSGLSEFLNISNGTLTSSNGTVSALSLVDGVYKLPLKEEAVVLDYNLMRNTYDLKTKDGQEIVSCSNITLVKPDSSEPFFPPATPSPNPILPVSITYCRNSNIWVTDFKNGTTYNFEANTSAVSLADVNKKIKEFCEQSSEKNFFNYMVENVKNFSNFFGSEKKDCYIDPKDITPNNIKTLSKLLGDVLNKTDGTQNIEKINNLISHVKKIENITNSSHFEQDQSVCKSSDDNDNGVKILPIVLPIVAAILIGVAAKSIRQLYKSGVAQLNRR
ncbi:hypothetical protein LBMAG18_01630 [Alphaproteobacteria bacterium]|nr:hypothetical protein LBMAG18_01630 [Alphaproteobacteria bacterium]